LWISFQRAGQPQAKWENTFGNGENLRFRERLAGSEPVSPAFTVTWLASSLLDPWQLSRENEA
jgi:hypothetical protein